MTTAVPTKDHAETLARIRSMGTLEVVPISQLHFDKAYQRDLRNDFAKRLANNWSTMALGFPLVSRRANGKMYVVNGQHRVAAASMKGLADIVCLVVTGLTERDEADLRLAGNVSLGETSLETFRAKVAAKYKEALDIVRICEQYDTRINESASTSSGINCISALEHLYDEDRGATLTAVFDVIRDAWGKVEGEYATANLIKAIAWMISTHENDENYGRDRFVAKLREYGPAALTMKMHAHRAVIGGSQWLNMYRGMVEVYNERLSEAARLHPVTRGWSKKGHGGGGWEG